MTCSNLNLPKLRHQLEQDEGIVHEIYLCPTGHPTFGVGHLITEDDPEHWMDVGTPVSDERVQQAFNSDINIAMGECTALYGDNWFDLPGEVKSILINMMFNLGRTRLGKFKKMNAAIKSGDWEEAAKEGRDSLWYRQVTNRAERLMRRMELVDD